MNSLQANAQLQPNWWYFGFAAGMHFTQGYPVADTSATFMSGTGSATMSDSAGNLLFYFGVSEVFNRNHELMPNSSNLLVANAEYGAVTFPKPGTNDQYYLFNTDYYGGPTYSDVGVFYHLIDMTLDNGLGDIVAGQKNIVLRDSIAEKIAATQHANGKDYWVMVQQSGSNKYHAFLVTESGVNPTPITSALGLVSTNQGHCQGTLRFNHRGDMFVNVRGNSMILMDFDNATGLLSNEKNFPFIDNVSFGAEFSADDTKLYTGGPFQFDVTLGSASAIEASKVELWNTVSGTPTYTLGLQYGLDGRIYGVNWTFQPNGYMSVINNPNEAGAACDYQDSALYLLGRAGNVSVPTFPSNFFRTNFTTANACVGDTALFDINYHFIDSVLWNFGDPGSGAANTSTQVLGQHVYASAGTYTVTLIAQNGAVTDTVIRAIRIKDVPVTDLGPDVELCATANDSVVLTATNTQQATYHWNTGSTDDSLIVSPQMAIDSGSNGQWQVWLALNNSCGSDTDTVSITASEPLTLFLPADASVCTDSLLVIPSIQNENAFTQYQWSTGNLSRTAFAISTSLEEQTITLKLTASNACNADSDSIAVTFLARPDGILPDDSTYCLNQPFYLLNSQSKGISYRWNDGTTGPQYRVAETGSYWLQSSSLCDTLIDTFNVVFNGEPMVDLGQDVALCPGEVVTLQVPFQGSPPATDIRQEDINAQSYEWNTGSTDTSIEVSDSGMYIVTVTLRDCRTVDSIRVAPRGHCPDRCIPELPNIITPNGDGVNDVFTIDMACNATDLNFYIYNRWGQLIYAKIKASISAIQWDGNINGEPASDGTYFYVLDFVNEAGESRGHRGSFSVLRR